MVFVGFQRKTRDEPEERRRKRKKVHWRHFRLCASDREEKRVAACALPSGKRDWTVLHRCVETIYI